MTNTFDLSQVRGTVERAIREATPPADLVERKMRPESTITWQQPTPRAGLRAALTVVAIAQQQAYRYVLGLRGEGVSWREVADLLDIPWSEEYSRPERAYELVLDPDPESSRSFDTPSVSWQCGGPDGCGKYITDRGPYNGHPADNEAGHASDCLRHETEGETYIREREQNEERARVADEAMEQLGDDHLAVATARRARWVLAHGGRYQGWSTSERVAVALVLRDDDELKRQGYTSRDAAVEYILPNRELPADSRPLNYTGRWLAAVRAAATGIRDGAR